MYRLLDSRGNACLLFKVDALLVFKFMTVHEELAVSRKRERERGNQIAAVL